MCDPASGTCGFPVAVGEYLRRHHPEIFRDAKLKRHFHHGLFHAFDFDNTMLRIGSMNMLLHGVENPTSATATRSLRTTRARRKNIL
jgi:type I restriction enzyme M protein